MMFSLSLSLFLRIRNRRSTNEFRFDALRQRRSSSALSYFLFFKSNTFIYYDSIFVLCFHPHSRPTPPHPLNCFCRR